MHQITDHCSSGIAVIISGIFGSRMATFIGDTVQSPLPSWISALQGPFGALVGLAVGLVWMSKRLKAAEDKADEKEKRIEEKNDKRETERDADRKALITVIEQNSVVLRDVKFWVDHQK